MSSDPLLIALRWSGVQIDLEAECFLSIIRDEEDVSCLRDRQKGADYRGLESASWSSGLLLSPSLGKTANTSLFVGFNSPSYPRPG